MKAEASRSQGIGMDSGEYRGQFFKMEGAGNDYIYIDLRRSPELIPALQTSLLPRLCDRRFGIGADGLVIIGPSEQAAGRMWMWNADGTSSSMCGNALRCVSLYLGSVADERRLSVESGVGIHGAEIVERYMTHPLFGQVRLDMGAPIFETERIPFNPEAHAGEPDHRKSGDEISRFAHGIPGIEEGYVLSMGNPHCVLFVHDPDVIDIESIGAKIEHHPAFPERTNIEFASVRSDGSLYQRTWERGSGETLACGSGACATVVASVLAGRGERMNTVHLRGGDLLIEWKDTVLMTGPARLVFQGQIDRREFDLFS